MNFAKGCQAGAAGTVRGKRFAAAGRRRREAGFPLGRQPETRLTGWARPVDFHSASLDLEELLSPRAHEPGGSCYGMLRNVTESRYD